MELWRGAAADLRARRAPADTKALLDQARTLINAAATFRADWPALFLARGEIDELERKPEQAIVSYRKAIDLGSRDAHGVYQLLQLLTAAQRFEEAEQLIRKMDQVGIGTPVGRRVVWQLLLKDENERAIQLGARVLRDDSKNFRDHLLQGQMLAAGGRLAPEAEAAFRRTVALGGPQPETWIALVRYLGSTGQYGRAADEIQNAAKKLDDNVRPLALASCYEALGAVDEAETRYRKALAQQPQSPRLLRRRGLLAAPGQAARRRAALPNPDRLQAQRTRTGGGAPRPGPGPRARRQRSARARSAPTGRPRRRRRRQPR